MKPLAQRLERYERHTRHCRHCKETLEGARDFGGAVRRVVQRDARGAGSRSGWAAAIVGQEGPAVVSLCIAGIMMNAAEQVRDMQNEFKTSVPRRGDPIPKLW